MWRKFHFHLILNISHLIAKKKIKFYFLLHHYIINILKVNMSKELIKINPVITIYKIKKKFNTDISKMFLINND